MRLPLLVLAKSIVNSALKRFEKDGMLAIELVWTQTGDKEHE
jgi:hypothetical protein